MSYSIEGKAAIVTGAANGLGLSIARHLASHGARVMMVDRDEARLFDERDTLRAEEGQLQAFAGDLRERLTIANLLSATVDAFDGVDLLINASRQITTSDPLDRKTDMFEELFAQNVLTSLRLSQAVAKRMIAQKAERGREGCAGSIVNISSIAAERAHPELLSYSVACAALNQMTRSLAVALAEHEIRVNALAVGSVMSASLRASLKEYDGLRAATLRATPLGRIAEARELCGAVQFLCSDEASFITGQVLSVDGGRSLIDPLQMAAH